MHLPRALSGADELDEITEGVTTSTSTARKDRSRTMIPARSSLTFMALRSNGRSVKCGRLTTRVDIEPGVERL